MVENHLRRINLFAGPGCGKSTLASYIFYNLKIRGFNIEVVQEYVKKMVYDGTKRRPYDQLKIFERQMEREESILAHNPGSIIVTDCPMAITIPYAIETKFPAIDALMMLSRAFDKDYPPLNVFIRRGNFPYSSEGRYQKTVEEAAAVDFQIRDFLEKNGFDFTVIEPDTSWSMVNSLTPITFTQKEWLINLIMDIIKDDDQPPFFGPTGERWRNSKAQQ